jgi:Ca2+/H+ antiporter, TMEM165/GDT1 family
MITQRYVPNASIWRRHVQDGTSEWSPMSVLAALGLAFAIIVLVELPDKTLVATLVLSTRYRVGPVLIGVASAFAVQCMVAVVAGGLLHLLPHRWLEVAVAVLFLGGAALLLGQARKSPDDDDDVDGADLAQTREAKPTWRIVLTCFSVLFIAEWGDASQLATAALVARTGQPWAVGLGAWLALTGVAVIAAIAGRWLVGRIPLRSIHLVAGCVFAAFAVVALIAAAA